MTRHFHTLDAMRGVAAIAVMLGHASTWTQPLPTPRAWLAVDFFFALSGFIICHVYENRLKDGMTTFEFMKLRYIRLYPMFFLGIAAGILSGLIALLFGKGNFSASGLALAAVSGLLMLPSPTWNWTPDLFPLNKPGWSLFFECFINLVYAVFWRQISQRILILTILISGTLLVIYCMMGDGYGGTTWSNFLWGFPRVSFSFFFGVLIARNSGNKFSNTRLAWLLPPLLIPILFSAKLAGPYIELLMVTLVFPAIVVIGSKIEPPKPGAFLLLGLISYPIYAIHEPIMYFLWRILIFFKIRPEEHSPEIGIAFAGCMVILCLALEKFYDSPIRRHLIKKLVEDKQPLTMHLKAKPKTSQN